MDNEFQAIGEVFSAKKKKVKPPAYEWQELALRVIAELRVPNNKRNSVFKVCKQNGRHAVEKALNDTKELCLSGSGWKYFFKIIDRKPPVV